MKELLEQLPYDLLPGSPTVTFVDTSCSLMLPYSAFTSGRWESERICLEFQGWNLEIHGKSLGTLWNSFQVQEVRDVRLSGCNAAKSGLEISSITFSENGCQNDP